MAEDTRTRPRVVALVPVKDGEDGIATTVSALLDSGVPERVIVIDDGSSDRTAEVAARAGATVLRHEVNRGKGGALRTGIEHSPEAEVYLLVDADLREHAATATRLVDELTSDRADLAIAVFPPSEGRAGAGRIKRFAGTAIHALSGQRVVEPISGQRAVRAELLRTMSLAPRFGVEVAMTIDAARAGARIVEVELPLDHDHTGRSWAGVRHRIGQGSDIVRALLPRIGSPRQRAVAIVLLTVLVAVGSMFGGAAGRASGEPIAEVPSGRVVVVGVPRVSFEDLDDGAMPQLRRLASGPESATATMTVRFPSRAADTATAFATASAGAPVAMTEQDDLSMLDETEGLGPGDDPNAPWPSPPVRLRELVAEGEPDGWMVSTRLAPLAAGEDSRSYGTLGALGQALRDEGLRTGFVGARLLDGVESSVIEGVPSALLVADERGRVDVVDGHRANTVELSATDEQIAATLDDTVQRAVQRHSEVSLLTVDSPRFAWPRPPAPPVAVDGSTTTTSTTTTVPVDPEVLEERRLADLELADRMIADLVEELPADTAVVVAGVTPPGGRWELTPLVLLNSPADGELTAPSTQRSGIVTLTDLAPTTLQLLGVDAPREMIGDAATVTSPDADLGGLAEIGRRAADRERTYSLAIVPFVVSQALIYGAYLLFGHRSARAGRILELLAVASAAWPLSTFLIRLLPSGWTGPVLTNVALLLLAVAIGSIAVRSRYHPLGPLVWVCAATSALLVLDMATGAHLQESSLIGYSPLTAARFYGLGNMAFAVFASASLMVAGALVTWTPRRREGLLAAACVLAVTLWVVAHPSLGADVGGALTLVPVYGAVLAAWTGMRFTVRNLVLLAVAGVAALGLMAAAMTLSGAETHLTSFLSDGDEAWSTIRRKLETNWRVLRITTWSWMVPIIVAFLVAAVFPRSNSRIRLGGTSLRATFLGIIAVGAVGAALNDSGVVITAMALIYVGSFLVLILERRPFAEPSEVRP